MVIDPTARVAESARLGENVQIGPFCVVGPDVELGRGVRLVGNVYLSGVTSIGEGTVIYPFASLGNPPQSVHYRGGRTRLIVGPQCEVREHVTMNTGTEDGGGVTSIGERCFIMVGSHIAHDCHLGSGVTFANNVIIGGHVTVGDNTVVGGLTAIHQHTRVGEGAMVGGMTRVRADVIPFSLAYQEELTGLNIVGLRRRGVNRAGLHQLRRAYRALFMGEGMFAARLDAVARDFAGDPLVEKVVAFIRAGGKRPLLRPLAGAETDENADDAA